MERRVLVVEDEEIPAGILQKYLHISGFFVDIIQDGLDVISYVIEKVPDIILLDLMLPGQNGISLCREIREFSQIPIIMTTAKVEEIDRLLGLELGADDYICKPYSPREVVARVKAVLRRSDKQDDRRRLEIKIDKRGNRILLEGRVLELTAVEFKLFETLFEWPGKTFSRAQLIEAIYPDQRNVCDRTIDSHIKRLRVKLAQVHPDEDCIQSVYGFGYKYSR